MRTGFRPHATWGLEGQGVSPTTLRRLRGQISGMSGYKLPGGCATTAIRLAFGEEGGPYISVRLQLLREWVALQEQLKAQDKALAPAWARTVARLRAAQRPWAKVRGTVPAVIATLLDLSWNPQSPTTWIDSDGERYTLEGDRDELLEFAVRGALSQQVWWEAASKWHLGAGLHVGVDMTVTHRRLRALRRTGLHDQVAVLRMIVTGSLWPAARRFGQEGKEDVSPSPGQDSTAGAAGGTRTPLAEETAEAVGSTAGAVRVAQHRALARLKSEIAGSGYDYA